MKALKQLLFLIKNDPRVKRLNELENVIDHSKKTKQIHEEVKQLQKALVRAKNNGIDYSSVEREYQAAYATLLDHPLLIEYLDLLSEINDDLQFLSEYIEKGLEIKIPND
jgi:cell fate (sporulation/competence/biofilm development) regulator YmcA (YheA/YmcA/DUF963 family)